jgi:hypothetical protein
MQTTSKLNRPGIKAYALTITIIFLAVALIVFASILSWAFSNATVTQRNNQFNMSQNAAEAAVERTIGQIDRDFINLSISNANAYISLPTTIDQSAWPVQYTFSDTNGVTGQISVIFAPQSSTAVALNSQYPGLFAYAQEVDVYATATPVGQQYNVPATVHESLQFANIPLFQFAIFYNINLEIDPGAAMTITGPVFCNQNIWEGSSVCTFSSTVTAVGTNYVASSGNLADPFALNYSGTGTPTFSMAGQPVNNANSLVMPIGTNNNPNTILGLLQLPPSTYAMGTAAAYSTNGQAYPANEADLVITNFASGTNDGLLTPTGTNLFIFYQDGGLAQIPFDLYFVTNRTSHSIMQSNYVANAFYSNVVFATYTFVTNVAFYDWREGWNSGSPKRVEAVQIDIAKLSVWLTNNSVVNSGYTDDGLKVAHSGHHICSAYVYNSVPLIGAQMPAVRLAHGSLLPNPGNQATPPGFSVATPFPMYVLGDYNSMNNSGSALGTTNTLYTYPAALMADAITILSDSWSDTNHMNKLPTPTSTTVNAAMLEGIVQSNPNISGNYSGGVENFLRLLENWNSSSTVLTYNGSIVVLFYSQWATNTWLQTGNYYNPPKRNWSFDMNFLNSAKLPPMTPRIKAMVRGQWLAHQ